MFCEADALNGCLRLRQKKSESSPNRTVEVAFSAFKANPGTYIPHYNCALQKARFAKEVNNRAVANEATILFKRLWPITERDQPSSLPLLKKTILD